MAPLRITGRISRITVQRGLYTEAGGAQRGDYFWCETESRNPDQVKGHRRLHH
jgi:hypothetical protein